MPSVPAKLIVVHEERNRAHPGLGTGTARGMVVHVGGVEKCSVLDYKFVVLGHNSIRVAAEAALLNAELIVARSLYAMPQIKTSAE